MSLEGTAEQALEYLRDALRTIAGNTTVSDNVRQTMSRLLDGSERLHPSPEPPAEPAP